MPSGLVARPAECVGSKCRDKAECTSENDGEFHDCRIKCLSLGRVSMMEKPKKQKVTDPLIPHKSTSLVSQSPNVRDYDTILVRGLQPFESARASRYPSNCSNGRKESVVTVG